MNIMRKIIYRIAWMVIIVLVVVYNRHSGFNLMFDPFSLLIAGIISSIKINKKVVSMKNQNDNQFVQDTIKKEQQGNVATSQLANKYFKDDMVSYMNFLNKTQ